MDVLDKEYLNWISQNTMDGKTLFYSSGMKEEEKDYAGIEELFNRVDQYVKHFYYFNVEEYGYIYNVRDRNNFYTLSKIYGPNIAYSITRDETRVNYIDLDDVRKNVLRGRENLEVSSRMQAIALHLRELNKIGVPMDLVEQETNKEIRLLKTKK